MDGGFFAIVGTSPERWRRTSPFCRRIGRFTKRISHPVGTLLELLRGSDLSGEWMSE